MQTIGLNDAMKRAFMGNPFSMTVVSFDKKRGKKGELIKYSNVIMTSRRKKSKKSVIISEESRDPKHFSNDTRNIMLEDGKIESFHPRLMIEFNGKEIVY